ncbi:MAG: GspE/PulE family protein [Acidobacteriota bacterium]
MIPASKKVLSIGPIGEKLIEAGLISASQLQLILNFQKFDGRRLGEITCSLGFVEESALARIIAQDVGIPFVELDDYPIDRQVVALIPERVARELKVLPLRIENGQLVAAVEDPLDIGIINKIRRVTGHPVHAVCATSTDIRAHINQLYAVEKSQDWQAPGEDSRELINIELQASEESSDSSAPIVMLINSLIQEALSREVTDIHFEPEEDRIRVRYRIDGILYNRGKLDRNMMSALVTRLKVMSELNITESRTPQSGRAEFLVGKEEVDIRVSTFPTIFGENVVLRLLNKDRLVRGLENLGYDEKSLEIFTQAIALPNGIILVTGPTGSGKTTTLYSALMHMSGSDKKIITLEDPVEYELPTIRQSQINPKAGLTFASGLRAILRQDPDIILIGEMRDQETIDTAIRSALTGHLVLSTLHTNDATGAITRLQDMEVEPYLISSSVILVIAQRLVRLICSHCKRPTQGEPKLLDRLHVQYRNAQFYEGEGCEKCNYTGYRGRTAIAELLVMTDKIRNLIMRKADAPALREAALDSGMKMMSTDGIEKVIQGKTTLREVLRVTSE